MTAIDFSFRDYAAAFDNHIATSIPNYSDLEGWCVRLSKGFVQEASNVVDVGCSTGRLLAKIRDYNNSSRRGARYVGIDIVPEFQSSWEGRSGDNLAYACADARNFPFENASLVISLFTLQFMPPKDRVQVLRRIHDGLVEGGAAIIAEKALASTARSQAILSSLQHQHKLATFAADAILEKDHQLLGRMVCDTEEELLHRFRSAGFLNVQQFWRVGMFVGYLVTP
jgi:tRNA (cmo5U34)-methyltransferase